jgi:hypothetical protein
MFERMVFSLNMRHQVGGAEDPGCQPITQAEQAVGYLAPLCYTSLKTKNQKRGNECGSH